MKDPLISVIMPTWNRADFIQNSINAILKQTFDDLELIIINDGSTDNTESIVSSYHDERIKYFSQAQAGPSAARNLGLDQAKGKWISFCDSDDVYFIDRLKQYYEYAQDQECLIYSGWVRFSQQHNKYLIINSIFGFEKEFNLDLFQYKNIFPSSAVMVKRSCLDKAGKFDAKLAFSEDWELFLRVSDHYPILQMKKPTFFYQVGSLDDPRKKHHLPENKTPAMKYIALKRAETLLDMYRKNKDSETAKKIFLAASNIEDAGAKRAILGQLDSFKAFTVIHQLIEKNDATGLEHLKSMGEDQLMSYLVKNSILNINVSNDLFEKDDFIKLQEGISCYY